MKLDSLDLLVCPACHSPLALHVKVDTREEVENGSLHCAHCNKDYLIRQGIPHFIRPEELTGLNRRFARVYDWFSYVYRPASAVLFAFMGGEKRYRREVLNRLDPKGGRVLEVSVGPGVNLPYLVGAPGVGEIYGLDISLGQLKRCQGFTRRRSWSVDLFLGNAEQLPFKDASFESVFHIGGINFFNDKKKAIEEMIRVARPGTKIIIVDETEKGARAYRLTTPGFERMFDGKREVINVPVDLVPPTMVEVRVDYVWRGFFYCLEFRKPW
jgi:ubiquinone/menaquinone biosynthesis C-methylase UbiE